MSQEVNDTLLERAYELAEELTSHPAGIDKGILAAIHSNDLNKVQYWITVGEGALAQQHFYESEILGAGDVY